MDISEAVFLNEGRIANQIGWDRRNCLVTREHAFHKIVVGGSLVDKTTSSGIHREQSRLGAVEDEMREQSAAAVRSCGDRCRRPDPVVAVLLRRNPCPEPLADCDTVAGISLMAKRMHGHGLRHEGCAEFPVVGIASGRKYYAFSRFDQDFLSAYDDARTGDGVPVAEDV